MTLFKFIHKYLAKLIYIMICTTVSMDKKEYLEPRSTNGCCSDTSSTRERTIWTQYSSDRCDWLLNSIKRYLYMMYWIKFYIILTSIARYIK